MTATVVTEPDRPARARRFGRPAASIVIACLLVALVGAATTALTLGAAGIPLARCLPRSACGPMVRPIR